jgi:hypothetical protein
MLGMAAGGLRLAVHHRVAGLEMLHDRAEDGGLHVVPFHRSALVTVTKSVPKKTPVTLSTAEDAPREGRFLGRFGGGKSAVPISSTDWPGRNFSVAGFGVDSV